MDKKRLPMSQLSSGMILAENIENGSGIILVPCGIRLTPMIINRLVKWGVNAVDVEAPDRKADSPEPVSDPVEEPPRKKPALDREEFVTAVTKDVSGWFCDLENDPLMMQLKTIAIRKLTSLGPDAMLNKLRMDGHAGDGRS